MSGKLTALFTEFDDRHSIFIKLFSTVFFFNLPLDRQAMTIPTRDVISVLTQHLL